MIEFFILDLPRHGKQKSIYSEYLLSQFGFWLEPASCFLFIIGWLLIAGGVSLLAGQLFNCTCVFRFDVLWRCPIVSWVCLTYYVFHALEALKVCFICFVQSPPPIIVVNSDAEKSLWEFWQRGSLEFHHWGTREKWDFDVENLRITLLCLWLCRVELNYCAKGET